MSATVIQIARWRRRKAVSALAVLALTGLALVNAQAASARWAPAPGVLATNCTVTWTGQGAQPIWTIPQNWSTGVVPDSASDVCIQNADVQVNASIAVHSLQLGSQTDFDLNGTAAHRVTATVATAVSLITSSSSGPSKIYLTDATLRAAQINDTSPNSFINGASGTNRLASPDLVVSNLGWLNVFSGKLIVTSMHTLANGTLTGGRFAIGLKSVLVLPGDVTRLVAASVAVTGPNEIRDQAGHNALAGLTSIDAKSFLQAGTVDLALNGSLTASGVESVGTLTVKGSGTLRGGTLSVRALHAGQVMIGKAATLGAGAITGNVVNSGTVTAPAAVTGNYTQTRTGSLSAFGGPLAVAGKATLSGSVDTSGTTQGATVALIRFASRTGNFTTHGLGFILAAKPHQIDAVIERQIAATPATVAPGGAITVEGAGFLSRAEVRIFLDVASGTPLATASAKPNGQFNVTATIPASTKAGTHRLIAVGSDNKELAHTTITVS